MTTNTGGTAFPQYFIDKNVTRMKGGMTLRDYFAAKAMQALIGHGADSKQYPIDAEQAYVIADAMLKARSEK